MCESPDLDAATAPSWPPQDNTPYSTHTYKSDEVLDIRLRLDGVRRTGSVLAHADWDGRRAVRLHFMPLATGERTRWVWWDPRRMQLHVHTSRSPVEDQCAQGDAAEVPVPAGYGSLIGEQGYQAGRWPRLEARVGGIWRQGLLLRRFRWVTGQQTVVTWMYLPAPAGWGGGLARYSRYYLWDPATTRLREPDS